MYGDLLATAVAAAHAGARVLARYFRAGELEVRAKAENDFVTLADRESEAAVVAEIRRRHPDHHVLAEERGADAGGGSDFEWLVDPLDGTNNFLQGLPIYCLSIACRRGARLVAGSVYEPAGENLFTATLGGGAAWSGRPMRVSASGGLRGAFLATGYPFRAKAALDLYLAGFRDVLLQARAVRRCGAAALDLAYTAAGVYDGFFEFRLSPWDVGAGALLVMEARGTVTDLDGGDLYLWSGNVVAGASGVQRELLACLRRHVDESKLDSLVPRPGR